MRYLRSTGHTHPVETGKKKGSRKSLEPLEIVGCGGWI